MATMFFSETTGEWAATRWYAGQQRGTAMDFGAREERAFETMEAARDGAGFYDETGRRYSGAEFEAAAFACAWTFGEYGGTFEMGTGDAATFAGC